MCGFRWGALRISSPKTIQRKVVRTLAKFKFFLDKAGYYRWHLIAGNGEKVAASEAYASYSNAVRSAKRVKELAANAIVEA